MPIFTSTKLTARRLLDFVPEDGCMLVFNASYSSWNNRTREQRRKNAKKLYVAVADPAGTQKFEPRRDLYIYRRDDK